MMDSKKFAKTAAKYSKQELITAVCHTVPRHVLESIALSMQQTAQNKLFRALEAASNEADDALGEYARWTKRMADKYGDGDTFYISDLSSCEALEGATIYDRYEEAKKREDAIYRKYIKSTEANGMADLEECRKPAPEAEKNVAMCGVTHTPCTNCNPGPCTSRKEAQHETD